MRSKLNIFEVPLLLPSSVPVGKDQFANSIVSSTNSSWLAELGKRQYIVTTLTIGQRMFGMRSFGQPY